MAKGKTLSSDLDPSCWYSVILKGYVCSGVRVMAPELTCDNQEKKVGEILAFWGRKNRKAVLEIRKRYRPCDSSVGIAVCIIQESFKQKLLVSITENSRKV